MSVPTAEELIRVMYPSEYRDINVTLFTGKQLKELAITLTKLHVEQALKEALDSIPCLGSSSDIATYEEVKDAVLNAYPLNLIK